MGLIIILFFFSEYLKEKKMLLLIGTACVISVLLVLIISIFCDADITTLFYEKYGKDLKKELQEKVVWITGASTGIGAAMAIECARKGAKLVISARRESLLEETKEKCIAVGSDPSNILVLKMDMCDFASHQKCFESVLEKFGKLDILINNAGRSQRGRWEHIEIDVDIDLFNLNVFSVINLTRTVLPHMLGNKSGSIAVTSSTAGKCGVPFSGTYTGSKHAIHGYFESLRTEKVGSGVDICLLCPGPTFSDLLEVAATENAGEKFGESMRSTDKRMTSERCAELSLIAIVNKLPESWICFRPVLPLMYATQYFPAISKTLMRALGAEYFAKVRDSRNAIEEKKK